MRRGWALVFDSPSFEAARATYRSRSAPMLALTLESSLETAYGRARELTLDSDAHKAKVFWVVLDA